MGTRRSAGEIGVLRGDMLAAHLAGPGVAVVCWRERGNLASHAVDSVLRGAAGSYPEVRFGAVDVTDDPELATEWGVDEVPALMVYRDGTLLFRSSGSLDVEQLDTLLISALSMDMGQARAAVDGHHSRFVMGFQVNGAAEPVAAGDGDGASLEGEGAKPGA